VQRFSIQSKGKVAPIHGKSNHDNVVNLVIDPVHGGNHPVNACWMVFVHVLAHTVTVQRINSS
jgi:hypothetical protein